MKTTSVVVSVFILFFLTNKSDAGTISLQEAITKKLVKAVISGSIPDTANKYYSPYYGSCLSLKLQNLGRNNLSIELENGRFLETADTTEQRMIVTQQEMISLLPGHKKSIRVYAMCTQMHDKSPCSHSLLALGSMASGNLLQLTRFIGSSKFQNQAAQEAIWVITDNNDIANIYSEDENEFRQLQQFVAKLTGNPVPTFQQRIEYADGSVSGEIVFENKKRESYTMFIANEAGEAIVTFFEDKTIERPMQTTLTWRFRYKGFQKGIYYVKLVRADKEVIANRPVVVN
jgi:hypothetical protein